MEFHKRAYLDDEEELELLLQKQSYLLELDELLEELELLLEELLLGESLGMRCPAFAVNQTSLS